MALVVFLFVVVLAETTALFLEYQNNPFMQQYVAGNTSTIIADALVFAVLSLASAYIVYRHYKSTVGIKGPGPFSRLGTLITRRHKYVIAVWILLLIVSIPAATRISQVVTSQTGGSSGSQSESTRAQNIITQEFPQQGSGASALIVIQSSDVKSNATKDFVLSLETRLLAPGELSYLEGVTSVYSVERSILAGGILGLSPAIYGLEAQTNFTAFVVYGISHQYLVFWNMTDQSHQVPTRDSEANVTMTEYVSGLASNLPPSNAALVSSYYSLFYAYWSSSAGNITLTSNLPLRATVSIDQAMTSFIQNLPDQQTAGFFTAVWTNFTLNTWSQPGAIRQFTIATISAGDSTLGVPGPIPVTFLNSIYLLGPTPTTAAATSLADQTIKNQSLSTYPLPVPRDLFQQFVSPKNDTMLVIVSFSKEPEFRASVENDPILSGVVKMRSVVSDLMTSNSGPGAPSSVYVTGSVATTADASISSGQDFARIEPVTIIAILLLVGLFFLAVVTPIVPLASIGLALVTAQALVFLIGTFVVPVQDTTVTFLTTIMLGVGTDYAIFLIARYREERVEGKARADAVQTSVTWVGESITTSGMTVILAFGAMTLSSFSFLRSMGIAVGTGVLVALLVSLTLIPALLRLIGDRAFWPTSGERFERYAARAREKRATRPSYFHRAASLSADRPKLVLLLTLLISAPAIYVSLTGATTYDFIAGLSQAESIRGLAVLEQSFGAGRIGPTQVVVQFPAPILQTSGLMPGGYTGLENLSRAIAGLANVQEVTGPTRPQATRVDATNFTALSPATVAAIRSDIGKDNRTAVLSVVLVEEPFTSTSLNTVQQIRSTAASVRQSDAALSDTMILVGGQTASTADFARETVDQFTQMGIIVVVGIFIILLVVLGSYILPVAAILSIGLSITWSYAATLVFFKSVLNSDVLFLIPLILFLLLFGIGMDYNIFILTRVREEAQKGKKTRDAVVDAVDRTGGIITALALILAGALGSLMLSSNRLLQGFGFAIALAVILDAMVVRTYLVPAIMTLLGKWAWMGPSRLQRVKSNETEKTG